MPARWRPWCTRAANGGYGRSLTLLPQDQQEVLAQRRREQRTEEWKARYDVRAGVESTMSQAVRRTGIRRTRSTGLPKTHLGNVLAATALNIIRLDARLTDTPSARPAPHTRPHSARRPEHPGQFADFPTES
jgi:hypothetical protein